jgi:hypothetical protein
MADDFHSRFCDHVVAMARLARKQEGDRAAVAKITNDRLVAQMRLSETEALRAAWTPEDVYRETEANRDRWL